MATNDIKIKELLKTIETKKASIGLKPRAAWKTNGLLKLAEGKHVNINTVNQVGDCVKAVAYLLTEQSSIKEASKLLGIKYVDQNIEDHLHDYKLRVSMLVWDEEKRKLDAMEQKLKDLRSDSAKTEDEIDGISQALGG